jgi:AcrR family transcriptional regulator
VAGPRAEAKWNLSSGTLRTLAQVEVVLRFSYFGQMATTSEAAGPRGRTRRADAERNRARILAAARELFGEAGLLVPMSEVARRAGVGIATLSRNFATREDLITATFGATMTGYADAIDTALADPDPWHGFCRYVENVCEMQAVDRGFTHVLTMTFPSAGEFEAERGRAYRGFVKLVKNAKATGRLRADFSPQDLPMILMANAGVVTGAGDAAPHAWRRLVAYLLQACAAEHAEPLPAAPQARQLYRALQQIGRPGT